MQAIFATAVFPPKPHFTPGTPVQLGVPAVFGPWTVRCDVVDATGDNSGQCMLTAPPLTMWDVLTGDFSYHLPMLALDNVAAHAATAPAPGAWLRLASAPVMPPLHGLDYELRCALPLVVCDCDGDDPSTGDTAITDAADDAPAGATDAQSYGPRFIVRRWSAAALAARQCVRVCITYARARRGDVHAEAAA